MTIYKANKYYTTMNYSTFIILGDDEEIMNKAHELHLNLINNYIEENIDIFFHFIRDNKLIYISDIDEPMEIGKVERTSAIECAIYNGKAYLYNIVNNYVGRF